MSQQASRSSVRLVERPRLASELDRLVDPGSDVRVVLVTAPPGFGKTTLVDGWVASRDDLPPVARVDLRRVGGPRSLWTALIRALTRVVDESLAASLRRLSVPDRAGGEQLVLELLDTVADQPLVLVLDDVQAVTSTDVLDELDLVVARAGGSLGLLLLSRTRPPLPSLHDSGLRGGLTLLRADDLAFTPAETAECCDGLDAASRRLVWRRTEGWPAMVRLMRMALDGGLVDTEPWRRDDGLAEHLFTEMFSRQDSEVQQVLLLSALPDPVPLELAVGLTGRSDAGAVLSETGRRSGLVQVWTDEDDEPVFHLHPILRAYLRGELLRRDVRAERQGRVQAAAWFRARGDAVEALRHALRSGVPEVLETTAAEMGLAAVQDGLAEPLLEVLGTRLTRGALDGWTSVAGAFALVDVGRQAEAATLVDRLPEPTDPGLAVALGAARSMLRRRAGRPSPELPPLPSPPPGADVELAYAQHHGAEMLRVGRLDAAERLLGRTVELAEGLNRPAALVDALVHLAAAASARSDVGLLQRRVARAWLVAERSGWLGSSRAAELHLLAGWACYQQLDEAGARRHAEHAAALLDVADDPTVVVGVRAMLAGTAEEATPADTRWLHRAWADPETPPPAPDVIAAMALAEAGAALRSGRPDRLREVVEALVERAGGSAETVLAEAHLELARQHVAEALRVLEPVLRGELDALLPATVAHAHAFAAELECAADNEYRAVRRMRRAVEVADALSLPRALLSGGAAGVELLIRYRGGWGVHERVVEQALRHVSGERSSPAPALTERELDVLRALPTMRTVDEIAGQMLVSVNTVKTHLRSVYRKLGVGSRRDAVSEARRLGLL